MDKFYNLMEIGKLTLQLEEWSWGNILQFTHEEVQQDGYYNNEMVDTEITVEEAKQLIVHLQRFVDAEEKVNEQEGTTTRNRKEE